MLVSEGEDKKLQYKRAFDSKFTMKKGYKAMITGISNLYNYKSYYSKLGLVNLSIKQKK